MADVQQLVRGLEERVPEPRRGATRAFHGGGGQAAKAGPFQTVREPCDSSFGSARSPNLDKQHMPNLTRVVSLWSPQIYLYIYIHICIHKYIHLYVYICICIDFYMHMYTSVEKHTHICMYVYIYIYIHTYCLNRKISERFSPIPFPREANAWLKGLARRNRPGAAADAEQLLLALGRRRAAGRRHLGGGK